MFLFLSSKWEEERNAIEMANTAIGVLWAFALNFMACELGQWVTIAYEQLEDVLCACNWYALPVGAQRVYFIFLVDIQIPINIRSYGDIECSRDLFKRVS